MSKKRTVKEYRQGSGTRGPVVRERKAYVADVTTKAEEDLTNLGEMEDQAKAEEETAEQDTAELAEGNVPGSLAGEKPPMGFSTGGID